MSKELAVLQGKVFFVELPSAPEATGYSWCMKEMTKELVLVGMETIPGRVRTAPVTQRFYFTSVSAENEEAEITFLLAKLSDISETVKERKVSVRIVPGNSGEFVSCGENGGNQRMVYGVSYMGEETFRYGYDYGTVDAALRAGDFKAGYAGEGGDARPYGYVYTGNGQDARPYGYVYTGSGQDARPYAYVYAERMQDARPYDCVYSEYVKDNRPYDCVYTEGTKGGI